MRIHRIRPHSAFQRVYREGRNMATSRLALYRWQGIDESKPTQVAVVAGKRLGNAVVRNRVRRRLREVMRATRSQLRPGQRLILVARRGALEAEYWQLQNSCLELLQRIGALRD